jgi:hypothetical protein
MRGDFSRDTFDAAKHRSRVLLQQGRVLLDADVNEQQAILLRRLHLLMRDTAGRHAAPADMPDSFKIGSVSVSGAGDVPRDFSIAAGRYYVEGVLCENDAPTRYTRQFGTAPSIHDDAAALRDGRTYLVYLDAWERHITDVEDPAIREVALGGPDTCSRAEIVWKVRVAELPGEADYRDAGGEELLDEFVSTEMAPSQDPMLRAAAGSPHPGMGYRGSENHLYRVEVHSPGSTVDTTEETRTPGTFKWSRDNGSAIFPIQGTSGSSVRLSNLGRPEQGGLRIGDWVEGVDDAYELSGVALPLLQVRLIEPADRLVTLSQSLSGGVGVDQSLHPYLRRWDQRTGVGKDGTIPIPWGDPSAWIELEEGVRIQFSRSGRYRTADFWIIPARTVTQDVQWPGEPGDPLWATPHGVEHFYAPLAKVRVDGAGALEVVEGYRRRMAQLWEPVA